VDLTAINGYYTLLAMEMNVARYEIPNSTLLPSAQLPSYCCCHQGTGVASGWPFSANIQLRTFAASDELAFVAL
jgi:hypothetical protein